MGGAEKSGFVAYRQAPDARTVGQVPQALIGKTGYVVMAHPGDIQFRRLSEVDLEAALPSWDEGRVFSDEAEVRWKRIAKGGFTLLLLTENGGRVPDGWYRLGEDWRVITHDDAAEGIPLWGERRDGCAHWVEVRIPRSLVYPVAGMSARVRARWAEYRDRQSTPKFVRLRGVD